MTTPVTPGGVTVPPTPPTPPAPAQPELPPAPPLEHAPRHAATEEAQAPDEPEPERPTAAEVAAELAGKVGQWVKVYADVAWRGEWHRLHAELDTAVDHVVVKAEAVARDADGALDKVHVWAMQLPDPPVPLA